MNGNSLVMLGILLLGIIPTLGFFSPGGAFILLIFFLFIFLTNFKGIKLNFPEETITPIVIIVLIIAGYHYGGFYQSSFSKAIGQIVFFGMIASICWKTYVQRKPVGLSLLIVCYLILSGWTLVTSPHPIVDTVVLFKEAPLKLLHGVNPYNTIYTRVYRNVEPNYYVHLPLSFLFYIPFVLLPIDERVAVVLITVASFLLLYKRIPVKLRRSALLPLSLVLFMPGSFYMLEHQFHESIIFFFFSLAVYFLASNENLYYLFISMFITVKQNLFLTIPFFVSKKIAHNRNLAYFILPFIVILFFFLWNPRSFISNTVFMLSSTKVSSPINMSLAFPILLGYFLPPSVPVSAIRNISYAILVVSYLLIIKFHRNSAAAKTASVVFVTYYFSYYAFFNSYYLVALLLLFDFIKENYFPAAIRSKDV